MSAQTGRETSDGRRRADTGGATRSLASLLPYLTCGEFRGFGPLHLLADDTLGFALEFRLPTVDTAVDGEEAIARAVMSLLHAVPPGAQWQWFVLARADVEAGLARYLTQAGLDPIGRLFAAEMARRWRDAQHDGFFPDHPEHNFFPRSQRIAIALKSAPIGFGRPDWAALLGASGARSAARDDAARFAAGARDFLSAVRAQGFEPAAIDADGLANWVADMLFPYRRFDRPPVSTGGQSVREALSALGRIEPLEARGFRTLAARREAHHRVVSMLWQPRAVRAGMLNGLLTLRPWLSISLTGAALPPAASMLQMKAAALLNARSTHRFNETEAAARADAIQDVEQRLFADGERLFEGRLQVHVIESGAAQAEEAALEVCKFLEGFDIEAAVEDEIGATLLLRGCLPFAVYPETERKLRRRRRFLSRDFADLHPAGGCWTGIEPSPETALLDPRAPVVMYSNPLGEPLFVDPSKAEKNPHALVIGQSGSGKSFFVHDYLLHLWRLPDVRLYLISIKADYRKLALLLGRYVELTLDSDVSLNPFGGAPTLENQARWFAALALMITEGRPERRLAREDEIALQRAPMAAAQRNWDADRGTPIRETVLEDVCVELERSAGAHGRQLAFQLMPYRKGPYRRLFNAPRGLTAADRFVFFNLGGILRQPCSPVVSFCVFNLVDEVMADARLRAVPKGLVADEVWALVRDPFAAAILERSLKAYRSLGAFALPIVQDPQDLDTPSGRVMLVNTATKVVLPLDRSGHDDLQRYVRLNERELEIVRNLRLVKRRYSEFFVSIEGFRSAKGLLVPDPLRYAVSTTDPADEELLDRYYRESGDMLAAVRRFAQQAPYGVRARADDAA
jgi:conjugal transfer ATP-binding protein TraC